MKYIYIYYMCVNNAPKYGFEWKYRIPTGRFV